MVYSCRHCGLVADEGGKQLKKPLSNALMGKCRGEHEWLALELPGLRISLRLWAHVWEFLPAEKQERKAARCSSASSPNG
jgi:hypothetical protein